MSNRGLPITKYIKDRRRKEAEQRQAEYDKLSLQEKVDRLPPEPHAKRQREKLLAQKTGAESKKTKSKEEALAWAKEVSENEPSVLAWSDAKKHKKSK